MIFGINLSNIIFFGVLFVMGLAFLSVFVKEVFDIHQEDHRPLLFDKFWMIILGTVVSFVIIAIGFNALNPSIEKVDNLFYDKVSKTIFKSNNDILDKIDARQVVEENINPQHFNDGFIIDEISENIIKLQNVKSVGNYRGDNSVSYMISLTASFLVISSFVVLSESIVRKRKLIKRKENPLLGLIHETVVFSLPMFLVISLIAIISFQQTKNDVGIMIMTYNLEKDAVAYGDNIVGLDIEIPRGNREFEVIHNDFNYIVK